MCRLSVNTKGIEVSWSSKPSTMYPLMCGCIGLSEIPPTGCKPGGGEQAYKPPQRTSSAPRSNQNILSSTRHLRRNCISALHVTFRPAKRGRDRSLEPSLNGSVGWVRHPRHVMVSTPVQCRRDVTGWGDEMTIYCIDVGCSSIYVSTLNRRDSRETQSSVYTETTWCLAWSMPFIYTWPHTTWSAPHHVHFRSSVHPLCHDKL